MTDAKELAATYRQYADRKDAKRGGSPGPETALLREAAAALEAQAVRIAALEQAAAPFVDAINPRMIQTDFDQEEMVSVTVTVADLRALARAVGGGE